MGEFFVPATLIPSATPTALQSSLEGTEVTVDPLRIVLAPGLASGVRGSQIPRTDGQDLPYWELTPGHTILELEGYLLQGKFHQPQIYVYPAQAYAEMVPAAFESIHRLDNILYPPGGPDINNPLPVVPFFNAAQVFATNIQLISFQNGGGVRFLTEYAQHAALVNNHDLFYHFQGVTRDGDYYIVAIHPISNPMLAETSDAGAPLPTGGVPYSYMADPNADMQSSYASITDVLNCHTTGGVYPHDQPTGYAHSVYADNPVVTEVTVTRFAKVTVTVIFNPVHLTRIKTPPKMGEFLFAIL